mgnify:FL=1
MANWVTKYQNDELKDGEYLNTRDNQIYFKDKEGNFVLSYNHFKLDSVETYETYQLQWFLDEIEREWLKSNQVYSMTDLLEINRELTIRELNQ